MSQESYMFVGGVRDGELIAVPPDRHEHYVSQYEAPILAVGGPPGVHRDAVTTVRHDRYTKRCIQCDGSFLSFFGVDELSDHTLLSMLIQNYKQG